MRKSILYIILTVTALLCSGFAINSFALDQSACANFPHNWGNNECLGLVEGSDLGSFVNGVWQWNYSSPVVQAIQTNTNIWSPIFSLEEMTPSMGAATIQWAVTRNHKFPEGEYPYPSDDSSLMFGGMVGGVDIPSIWQMKMHHDDGTTSTGWHLDWIMNPSCGALCDQNGCPFDCKEFGCPEVTAADGTICTFDPTSPHWPNVNLGPMFRTEGGEKMKKSNIVSITWKTAPGGPEVVGVKESPLEIINVMKYGTGQNMLYTTSPWRGDISVYTEHFSQPAPLGTHMYEIRLADGAVLTATCFVNSDREMPVVPKYRDYTVEKIKTKKSGKVVTKTGQTVLVANLTAREIFDEDAATRLLVQWAEPDLAMTFSEFAHSVRLRIYIGDGWLMAPEVNGIETATFLWIDAPLHTGSVVIPPAEYAELKARVNGPIYVSGMYREEYPTFHNRGYFEYIMLP